MLHYGFRGLVNDYFSSYLTNRYQYVSCENVTSAKLPITFGVPQRSVIGPLLFLLYINDLANCCSTLPKLFADDTCIVIFDSDSSKLPEKINLELCTGNVNKRLKSNKLTLNFSKSNLLIISPTKSKCAVHDSLSKFSLINKC